MTRRFWPTTPPAGRHLRQPVGSGSRVDRRERKWERCETCKGTGRVIEGRYQCQECRGAGVREVWR
jgi:DnaJ-class molecular chaperone